jgi:hypothetical protein
MQFVAASGQITGSPHSAAVDSDGNNLPLSILQQQQQQQLNLSTWVAAVERGRCAG